MDASLVGHVLLLLCLTLAGCAAVAPAPLPAATTPVAMVRAAGVPRPPVAAQHPYAVPSPNGSRTDDYYWLRDDTRTSGAVLDYLREENAYRDALLAPTARLQDQLFDELTARLQPDESTVPVFDHGYWYYQRFVPGGEYPFVARRANTADGTPAATEQMLLDGPALARGHDFYRIGVAVASPDGRWLAYCVDTVGRRQYQLQLKNLDSGVVTGFAAENVEPEVVWTNDSKSVLYIAKDPVTLQPVRVLQHVLGTDVRADTLLYEERDNSYDIALHRSASDEMLFIELSSTQQSEWLYARADDPRPAFRAVRPRERDHLYFVDHMGGDFIIRSNWQAPNFRIVRVPVAGSADKRGWQDVVPARADVLIETFALFRDYLALNERAGGLRVVRVHPWSASASASMSASGARGQDVVLRGDEPAGVLNLVVTPGLASVDGAQRMRYVYSSLKTPATTFERDLVRGTRAELKREQVLGGFDSANYVTEIRRAPAGDGALIPVSIVYRKGTRLDGSAPLWQYGYGSYGYSIDPEFKSDWVSLLDRGFVVALAHVRGGQELGRSWYDAGRLQNKRNTFTDFVDVTAFLVRGHYAAPDKIVAEGRSAGGLLMGVVANIAPLRYRAIIAGVPFVDVVTTMLDETIPLTTTEFDQWGDPKQKSAYDYMLSYSPYDNVSAQAYPALFVSTGLWDSQVQYFEPAKWVAKLRALNRGANPIVLSVDMQAGHGGKPGRLQRFRETTREYAFVLWLLGIER